MSAHPPRLFNHSTKTPRHCLITGATSEKGIGRATAKLFASHGARVCVTDIPKLAEEGKELVEEIKKDGGEAVWIPLDVTDEESWKTAIAAAEAAYGPLDVLFNNAGIAQSYTGPLQDHPSSHYKQTMAVNSEGVYLGIKYAARSMQKRSKEIKESASIVNVSSVAGLAGNAGPFEYTMSKHAVAGATKWACINLAPHNIRVNSVHPGPIDTNIFDGLKALTPEEEAKYRSNVGGVVPLKRWADPVEVANMVLFLASPESSFCTGGQYTVDGGFMAVSGFAFAREP